jgi:hypothetical protein
MCASPYTCRAASRLCDRQRILQFSTVEGPPFPRGTRWSISSRAVAPHTPPSARFHWHFPWSLFTTSRFTLAGTQAVRFACFSMSNSSAAVRTSSSLARGFRWESPAFALFSSARNFLETVMCIRLAVAVIGTTIVRSTSIRGMPSSPGRISGTVCFPSSTGSTGRAASTRVTTVLVGTSVRGFNSAASSRASCLDRP